MDRASRDARRSYPLPRAINGKRWIQPELLRGRGIQVDPPGDTELIFDRGLHAFIVHGDPHHPVRRSVHASPPLLRIARMNGNHRRHGLGGQFAKFPDPVVAYFETLLVGLALRFAPLEIRKVLGIREGRCHRFKGPVPAAASAAPSEFIIESLLRLRAPESVVFDI